MLRLLFRLIGLILLACGFIALIVDGTRSIAGGALFFTSIRRGLTQAFPNALGQFQASVEALSRFLWDPVLTSLMIAPLSVTLAGLGAGLIILSHRRGTASTISGVNLD